MIQRITNIFEDYKRKWGKSNVFSEGHRSLSRSNYMLDIDCLYYDNANRKIVVILEDKYKFSGLINSNLLDKGNFQRKMLNQFCKIIDASLVFKETSTDSYYYVKNSDVIKHNGIKESLSKYHLIDTENKLYVEMPNAKLSAVMYIDDGTFPLYIAQILSETFKTYRVRINDGIKIKAVDYVTIENAETILDSREPEYIINNEDDWKNVYSKIGLLSR